MRISLLMCIPSACVHSQVCPTQMTSHHDSKGVHWQDDRFFFKMGGHFQRDADDRAKHIHDAHAGMWAYTLCPEGFIYMPEKGCTAKHLSGTMLS